METMTVGELARRSGLTVRTLHHYDAIGLLSPAQRSVAGYRLYGREELSRLTQILILRRLGLTLNEIRQVLARPESTLAETIRRQIRHLKERIALETGLVQQLEAVHRRLVDSPRTSFTQLTELMEMMTMFEKYYTPEQMDYLEKRRRELGEETIRAAEQEWPRLIARMQEERAKGTDPEGEVVQALARRWQELLEAFTGGDEGIAASLGDLYVGEPGMRQQVGLEPGLMEYVGQAIAASRRRS